MKEIKISQNDDKALYELMLKEKTEPSDQDKDLNQVPFLAKDKVLENFYDQVGYSKYQFLQIFLISLLNVSIGAESIFLNVVELQLIAEWRLEMYQAAMLVSCFSFGIAIGKKNIFFFLITIKRWLLCWIYCG